MIVDAVGQSLDFGSKRQDEEKLSIKILDKIWLGMERGPVAGPCGIDATAVTRPLNHPTMPPCPSMSLVLIPFQAPTIQMPTDDTDDAMPS